jgi:2-alkyl-3-oxoalkanoate reductase
MGAGQTRVLVTGATGFLGQRLVAMLLEKAYRVRGFARKLPANESDHKCGEQYILGDIADLESLRPAFRDIDVVVHAAADTKGTEEETKRSTIQGTKNVVALCEEYKVAKLIYLSSLSVYEIAGYTRNQVITEESPLEAYPQKRGFYSFGKIEAEKIVNEAMAKKSVAIVCLRPGTIFGPGGKLFTPMVGFTAGANLFVVIGPGSILLPLVYLDNLVDVIIAAIDQKEADGKTFNVVDPEPLSKNDYVNILLKKINPQATFVYIPYHVLYGLVYIQEYLMKLLQKRPFLTRYRLASSQKSLLYDSSRIMNELNWKPLYTMNEAFQAVMACQRKKGKGSL